MKLKTILTNFLLLSCLASASIMAQPNIIYVDMGSFHFSPIKSVYGQVSKEDLSMTRYAPDTSANAVVLLDNGFLSVESTYGGWKCYLTCLHRVKILKKSAFDDYGKHEISTRSNERLVNVKAHTINPDSSIIKVKEFFDEKSNKYVTQKKFAFPNLQEGSIVEYEYTMETKDIFSLLPWYFQAAIPVRHSELIVDITPDLNYIYFFKGAAPKQDVYKKEFKNVKDSVLSTTPYTRYSLDSLDAMKPESYVSTLSNYTANMKFQLSQINAASGKVPAKKILQDWNALAKEFMETKDLGQQLTNKRNYNDVWKAVKPSIGKTMSDEDKIRTIYAFINKNVEWIDDYFSIYIQGESLDEAFKKKKANSAELNLMLVTCLNEAGVPAFPLLVSTSENGLPYTDYPIGRQFNHLLCYVELNGKPQFLDAGNIYRPTSLPRIVSLNHTGWVLDKNNPRWVKMPAPLSSETMLAIFDLQENGTLKGRIDGSYTGYAAVNERTSLKDDEKNEKLKKEWARTFADIQLDSIVVGNQDSVYLPFKRIMNCTIPNAAIVADDLMYIKPTLKTDFDENPFKQEKRNYPVDFPYPIRDYFVLNLTIPDDYEVEELPKDQAIALSNDAAKFVYSCTKTGNRIQFMYRIDIRQLQFQVEDYVNLKSFFNQIASKRNEQIVLKKKKKP